MHFRVTEAFAFLFVFLSIHSMANPLSSSPRDNVDENGLDARQIGIAADIVAGGEQSMIHHSYYKCANMIPQSSPM